MIAFPHSVLRQAVIGIGACHGMRIVYIGFHCTLSTRASSQSESTLFLLNSACYSDGLSIVTGLRDYYMSWALYSF